MTSQSLSSSTPIIGFAHGRLACDRQAKRKARLVVSSKRLLNLLGEIKPLAHEYHKITGRPLGVTAEIAEYEAARILKLKLSPARQSGYDAIRKTPRGDQRLQIKGRRILPGAKSGQRLGSINLR
jgi:hypothetical protein